MMEPFSTLSGIAAPLDRSNVDTDAIIPKQFLRKIDRAGFGKHLFHEWRYTNYDGTVENPDFILNKDPYRQAAILLARDNFGCGSSREHAPWALYDFGFRCIIAPSFADIFYSNAIRNGILPVRLEGEQVEDLFTFVVRNNGASLTVDLPSQTVAAGGKKYSFEIDAFNKECLIKGLDQIGWTMQFVAKIDAYEARIAEQTPWLK